MIAPVVCLGPVSALFRFDGNAWTNGATGHPPLEAMNLQHDNAARAT
jgi:hypothetical protein